MVVVARIELATPAMSTQMPLPYKSFYFNVLFDNPITIYRDFFGQILGTVQFYKI